MVLVFYQDNTEVIDSGSVIVVDPRVQISGLTNSYPEADTPLADDDKLIVRQGNDWKEVKKSEFGGGNIEVGYNELKPELKEIIDVTITNNVADIEMNTAVAFQLPELIADTTINFKNLQENKQVKLYIKGNFALTFTAENSVPVITDNLSYVGNNWNIIVAEVSNVNGSLQINLMSLQ